MDKGLRAGGGRSLGHRPASRIAQPLTRAKACRTVRQLTMRPEGAMLPEPCPQQTGKDTSDLPRFRTALPGEGRPNWDHVGDKARQVVVEGPCSAALPDRLATVPRALSRFGGCVRATLDYSGAPGVAATSDV